MKKAIILGASGLVGSFLLDELLNSKEISEVHSFARSSLNLQNPKLSEHLGDLLSDEFWEIKLEADLIFVCIGTTQAKTPDSELYFKIDHGIPVSAAQWAARNGLQKLMVVSSLGADVKARNSYLSIKGKMERDVMEAFSNAVAFRPSMILGPRKEKRFLEAIGRALFRLLNPLIPKKYRGVEAKSIAQAMYRISLAEKSPEVIYSADIPELAKA